MQSSTFFKSNDDNAAYIAEMQSDDFQKAREDLRKGEWNEQAQEIRDAAEEKAKELNDTIKEETEAALAEDPTFDAIAGAFVEARKKAQAVSDEYNDKYRAITEEAKDKIVALKKEAAQYRSDFYNNFQKIVEEGLASYEADKAELKAELENKTQEIKEAARKRQNELAAEYIPLREAAVDALDKAETAKNAYEMKRYKEIEAAHADDFAEIERRAQAEFDAIVLRPLTHNEQLFNGFDGIFENRLIQEAVNEAIDQGAATVHFPTRETLIEIEQWERWTSDVDGSGDYDAIIRRYQELPERLRKLYGRENVNTRAGWVEVKLTDKIKSAPTIFYQAKRDNLNGANGALTIKGAERFIQLAAHANPTTFLHELSHWWLLDLENAAKSQDNYVAQQMWADINRLLRDFRGNTTDQISDSALSVSQHETFAAAFEDYLFSGEAPAKWLRNAFEWFRDFVTDSYRRLIQGKAKVSPEIRAFFDSMLSAQIDVQAEYESRYGADQMIELLRHANVVSDDEAGKLKIQQDRVRGEILTDRIAKNLQVLRDKSAKGAAVVDAAVEKVENTPKWRAVDALKKTPLPGFPKKFLTTFAKKILGSYPQKTV